MQIKMGGGTEGTLSFPLCRSAEGNVGQCEMPCAALPTPKLASIPHLPLLWWPWRGAQRLSLCVYDRQDGERRIHPYYSYFFYSKFETFNLLAYCKSEWDRRHGHICATVCEHDKCGVVPHPSRSERYLEIVPDRIPPSTAIIPTISTNVPIPTP